MSKSNFVGREEILGSVLSTEDLEPVKKPGGVFVGREEILGDADLEEIITSGDDAGLEEIITSGCDRTGREEILGLEEILGGAFVGDDERQAAMEGGPAERGAFARRSASCGFDGKWRNIRPSTSSGEDSDFNKYMAKAKKDKKISRADLQKSLEALFTQAGATTDQKKSQLASIVVENLHQSGVTISGAFVGGGHHHHGKRLAAVKAILEPALAAKTISRADLKRAIDAGSKPGASDADKVATGKRIAAFLGKKGVQIQAA